MTAKLISFDRFKTALALNILNDNLSFIEVSFQISYYFIPYYIIYLLQDLPIQCAFVWSIVYKKVD